METPCRTLRGCKVVGVTGGSEEHNFSGLEFFRNLPDHDVELHFDDFDKNDIRIDEFLNIFLEGVILMDVDGWKDQANKNE